MRTQKAKSSPSRSFPPAVMGKDIPLSGIFDENHPRHKEAGELRSLYEAEAEVKQIIDTARGIEGLIRQPGVHAAGVIMSAEPLTDRIPVWTRHTDGAVGIKVLPPESTSRWRRSRQGK